MSIDPLALAEEKAKKLEKGIVWRGFSGNEKAILLTLEELLAPLSRKLSALEARINGMKAPSE